MPPAGATASWPGKCEFGPSPRLSATALAVPPLLVRGASHFATPEVLAVLAQRRWVDFGFGLAGNPVRLRQAGPVMQTARPLCQQQTVGATAYGESPPASRRLYEACPYAAASWDQPWRVLVKAEVMAAGDTPRLVVTS
jgi:hypothetical protein